MKIVFQIIALFMVAGGFAQTANKTAFYSSGDVFKVHRTESFAAGMGIHTNFINNDVDTNHEGLIGFYGIQDTLTISGAFAPVVYDTEFGLINDGIVRLESTMHVSNHSNFIYGKVITPRENQNITLNYLTTYANETNGNFYSFVDGYVSITDKAVFTFPVGQGSQFKPLSLNSEGQNEKAICAYYFENPNEPSNFDTSFDTKSKPRILGDISQQEFWHLTGSVPSSVSIPWNAQSQINEITDDIAKLVVVGWNKAGQEWESLGGTVTGNPAEGIVISDQFIPDNYEVLTFAGGDNEKPVLLDLGNYLVTANNDGVNDNLIFGDFFDYETYPSFKVSIYDRYGLKVFEKDNYYDEFNGMGNTGNFVIKKENGLPAGVYFYIVTMEETKLQYQGYLYLGN